MERKTRLPELLAPAGDFTCLLAAVEGGADAVYIGGRQFSARAFAKNFDGEELSCAVRYAHLHGVKLYVTVNTLLYDTEGEAALDYVRDLYRAGVDALIITDPGLVRQVRRQMPDFELHGSTQMTVHNTYGAQVAARMGMRRIVLSREMSLDNIRSVVRDCPIETEIFIHGALCVCYSGQCLFSSLVGGRSGNRGECAQPCRLPYGGGAGYRGGEYPLSLSDLSLAAHIPQVIDSGVSSLKIEGRMKSPDYVYGVTRIYRTLLDEGRCATGAEMRTLAALFSRGGFTDGYFRGQPETAMTGVRSREDKQRTEEEEKRQFLPRRVPVRARVRLAADEPAEMTLSGARGEVRVCGGIPQEARNIPLSADEVRARLAKTGNTYLSLDARDIDLSLGDNLFFPPGELNALRRAACAAYEETGRADPVPADCPPPLPDYGVGAALPGAGVLRTALFLSPVGWNGYAKSAATAEESWDIRFAPLFRLTEYSAGINGVYLPPVYMNSEEKEVRQMLSAAAERGIRYALVGNLAHLPLCREAGLCAVGDFRMNVCNGEAARTYFEMGLAGLIVSAELTLPMARDIARACPGQPVGAVVYGRIPLMLTERCFMRENFGCERCGEAALTDRRGARFPLLREYAHRNLLCNCHTTYMGDRRREMAQAGLTLEHSIFTVESGAQIASVCRAFADGAPFPLTGEFRRMGKR